MSNRLRSRCPYTLKPLAELAKESDEHIFPHSLGGPKSYSVRVDAVENSTLGSSADAAFVDSPLLAMMRSQHGIKSRSGVAKWQIDGEDTSDGRAVKVTIPHQGPAQVRHKRQVEIDSTSNTGRIIASAEESERLLAQLKGHYAEKGMTLEVQNEERKSSTIRGRLLVPLDAMLGGLAKIAYLAAFEFLGDQFLDDPLNVEWQKAIRAGTAAEFMKAKIHGRPFGESGIHNAFLPPLASHEHAVTIGNFYQLGPMVAVKLFGTDLLSLVCRVSDTSTFDLGELEGKIVVCDARVRQVQIEPFRDFILRRMSGQMPPR